MEVPDMTEQADIFNRLSQVETETQSIKTTIEHHGNLLETYGIRQQEHGTKLDDIITAVTRQAAKAEANPRTDWLKVAPVLITTAAALVSMFAIIMGGLVYLIILLTSKDAELNKVVIQKNYEIEMLRNEHTNRQLEQLRKRVQDFEIGQRRTLFYSESRRHNTIYLPRSGY